MRVTRPTTDPTSPADSTPDEARQRMRVDFEIRATRDAGGVMIVEGIAYPALRLTGEKIPKSETFRIDSHKTWMSPDTLRTFAHRMLERGTGGIDSQHDHENVGVIVESHYRLEASGEYPADVWVVAVKVLRADTQEAVRSGKLTGFSIEFTGRYREAVLDIDGVGRMKTNEIVTPYPLTLSIVDRPAIRLPFTSVEARTEGDTLTTDTELAARCAVPTDHDGRGVTVLVRFAPEEEHPPMSEKTATTTATEAAPAAIASEPAPTTTAVSKETPAARAEATPAATEAATAQSAPATVDPEALKRAVRETILSGQFRAASETPVEGHTRMATAMKRSTDYTSLAAVWQEYSADWELRDSCRNAMYAAESVLWEVLYDTHGPALAEKLRAIAPDLGVILEGIVSNYEAAGGTAEERAARAEAAARAVSEAVAEVRAGKKLSKASRERIQKAHDNATGCVSELRAMLDETAPSDSNEAEEAEKGEDHEGEEAVEAKSATPAPETATDPATTGKREGEAPATTAPPAVVDVTAVIDVASLRAEFEASMAAQRKALDEELAKVRAEVASQDAALATEKAAREAAEKRAEAFGAMRPGSRGGLDETPPNDAPNATRSEGSEPRDEGFGGILGLRTVIHARS